ncbi:hypothetical protein L6452_09695 [Arctium lappa]|uniref:Uncharacterized protein n=1 Tax=Arctium lappa TaxID=4217 RepID=A0ACB9DL33_ARCLA|nr:hypothetical protein L6452_09695 [Arctium lappa]
MAANTYGTTYKLWKSSNWNVKISFSEVVKEGRNKEEGVNRGINNQSKIEEERNKEIAESWPVDEKSKMRKVSSTKEEAEKEHQIPDCKRKLTRETEITLMAEKKLGARRKRGRQEKNLRRQILGRKTESRKGQIRIYLGMGNQLIASQKSMVVAIIEEKKSGNHEGY